MKINFKFGSLAAIAFLGLATIFTSCGDDPVPGCIDENADNYNAGATEDNGSCTYAADAFIGEYFGTLACEGAVDAISTDSLSFTINFGVQGPGNTVAITLNNVGVTFNGEVSGNVISVNSVVPGFTVPNPFTPEMEDVAVDLVVSGMPTINESGNTVSGDLSVAVWAAGSIDAPNVEPIVTENCAMLGEKI